METQKQKKSDKKKEVAVKKKLVETKTEKIKITSMIAILYRIKVVILAFVSGLLLGLSTRMEQLQLVKLKSIIYGIFVFLLFDVIAYSMWILLGHSSKEKGK